MDGPAFVVVVKQESIRIRFVRPTKCLLDISGAFCRESDTRLVVPDRGPQLSLFIKRLLDHIPSEDLVDPHARLYRREFLPDPVSRAETVPRRLQEQKKQQQAPGSRHEGLDFHRTSFSLEDEIGKGQMSRARGDYHFSEIEGFSIHFRNGWQFPRSAQTLRNRTKVHGPQRRWPIRILHLASEHGVFDGHRERRSFSRAVQVPKLLEQ